MARSASSRFFFGKIGPGPSRASGLPSRAATAHGKPTFDEERNFLREGGENAPLTRVFPTNYHRGMWTCASRKISGPALVLAALLTGCMGTLITDETSGSNPHDPTEGEGDKSDRSSEPVTLPGGLRLAGTPEYHRFVRLTHEQWDNAVRDVFGLPATDGWSSGFVPHR